MKSHEWDPFMAHSKTISVVTIVVQGYFPDMKTPRHLEEIIFQKPQIPWDPPFTPTVLMILFMFIICSILFPYSWLLCGI
jgi:hypothetical protein